VIVNREVAIDNRDLAMVNCDGATGDWGASILGGGADGYTLARR
jgi:hypothetical protein